MITGTINCHVLMRKYVVTHHVAVLCKRHNKSEQQDQQTLESYTPPVASGMF